MGVDEERSETCGGTVPHSIPPLGVDVPATPIYCRRPQAELQKWVSHPGGSGDGEAGGGGTPACGWRH